jgi:hypothetical protein
MVRWLSWPQRGAATAVQSMDLSMKAPRQLTVWSIPGSSEEESRNLSRSQVCTDLVSLGLNLLLIKRGFVLKKYSFFDKILQPYNF